MRGYKRENANRLFLLTPAVNMSGVVYDGKRHWMSNGTQTVTATYTAILSFPKG
jgi:hypothetical protein